MGALTPIPAAPLVLFDQAQVHAIGPWANDEKTLLVRAGRLFNDGYFDHALLDIWNAAVCNLRRRVEAYGVDIFQSIVKEDSGRKKYDLNGESLAERWSGVDEVVLLSGCTKLGLINKKAAKVLETINWMRNHTSPAHPTDGEVQRADVVAFALLLQENLFANPLPAPGHSVAGLFQPVKSSVLTQEGLDLLLQQIQGLSMPEVRTAFGFMLDVLVNDENPALENVLRLFPSVWNKATADLRKSAGAKYHAILLEPSSPARSEARDRLLGFLTSVDGVGFIPDAARANIYRRAAELLAEAKDTSYGWGAELAAARAIAQFGPHVPAIAFDEVYQEILAVWCGNYWGRSNAHERLKPFIDALESSALRRIIELFNSNERVRSELFNQRPKQHAIDLLNYIRARLTLEAHRNEVDAALNSLPS